MLTIAWNKLYVQPLPPGHRFPMEKYNLIPEQLLYEGLISKNNIFDPGMAEETDILKVHTPEYLKKLNKGLLNANETRRIGFPYSELLVRREYSITSGTVLCALNALKYGVSLNVAGGTHHAYADRGEGFCLFNDVAVAARYLLDRDLARKILIVDLDVHQGNGSAFIFRDEYRVFTFSMHGKNNYPLYKEKSDLDIELEDRCDDASYLKKLESHLPRILQDFGPDFIFYVAGVDVLKTDKLGRLALSVKGSAQRDRMVFELCLKNNLPVTVVMGGGYSQDIRLIVEAHCNTYRLADQLFF